jgi:hypothetical protein
MQIKKNRDQNEMELLGAKQYKRKWQSLWVLNK